MTKLDGKQIMQVDLSPSLKSILTSHFQSRLAGCCCKSMLTFISLFRYSLYCFVHKYTGIFQSLASPSVVMDWLNKENNVTVDTVTSAKMNAVTMQTNQKIKNAS